jgi:diguanylate cyclase (GGDEF)-like protein
VNDDVLANCGSAGDVASSGCPPGGDGRTRRTLWVPRPRQDVRLSYAVLGMGAVAIVVFLVAPVDSVWQMISHFVPLLLATACLLTRARSTPREVRRPLLFLCAGQLIYFALSIPWYFGPVYFHRVLPFPSVLDPLYFLSYILYAVFLAAVLRRRTSTHTGIAATDALILTTALTSAVWVWIIHPQVATTTVSLGTSVAVLYPVFTLVLFCLAARLAIGGGLVRTVPGALLLLFIAAEVAGDIFYGVQSVNGTFRHGGPLSATWMTSYTALAALAAHPGMLTLLNRRAPPVPATAMNSETGRSRRLVVLWVAALVPVTFAGFGEPSLVLFGAATLTFSLVIFRALLLSRELEQLACTDQVTGCGNRTMLHDRAAVVACPGDLTRSLLLLDLDGFKEVNDTLGHPAGDDVLGEVGRRISRCVRAGDTVTRLGGDEFAVLLPGSTAETALLTANRMLAQLQAPFSVEGTNVRIGGSIGVAVASSDGDFDELLRDADLAMYAAKALGGNSAQAFHPAMYERVVHRMQLAADVRGAFDDGQFSVSYQPIVDAATGRVTGLEALVRWEHPERGVLPPSEFLSIAEDSGLITDLGQFVLRTACEQLVIWREQWPTLTVAVNVAHSELRDPGFTRNVARILADTGLPGRALHLEITETVLVAHDDLRRVLETLRALDVEFAIDDFGTGQSSLSRLRDLPVRRLKIDRSFMSEIGTNDQAPLLASIIGLAHSLGRIVIAEGVETPPQAAFLIAHGCDELQGYLFGCPLPAPLVLPMLNAVSDPSRAPV